MKPNANRQTPHFNPVSQFKHFVFSSLKFKVHYYYCSKNSFFLKDAAQSRLYIDLSSETIYMMFDSVKLKPGQALDELSQFFGRIKLSNEVAL